MISLRQEAWPEKHEAVIFLNGLHDPNSRGERDQGIMGEDAMLAAIRRSIRRKPFNALVQGISMDSEWHLLGLGNMDPQEEFRSPQNRSVSLF